MLFTLEALEAKKGDCLLLHLGAPDQRRLILIDGGPSGVYPQSLEPRLRALKPANAALSIDLLLVSHVDDDHIRGVLDLTGAMVERDQRGLDPEFRIWALWHNSFDDVVGDQSDDLTGAARALVSGADLSGESPAHLRVSHPSALVLASVAQGRQLRADARALAIEVNRPGGGLITTAGPVRAGRVPAGVELIVAGPLASRVREFRAAWDEYLEKKGLAQDPESVDPAEYLDESVFNLASIVVLARAGGQQMLLTGDARGDDIIKGLRTVGALGADGRLHVGVLKLPHHGSDRNVETDFFRSVTADHYVVSGDGSYGNPELATFEMLFEARRGDPRHYTIHLTYPAAEFKAYRGRQFPLAKLQAAIEREKQAGQSLSIATPQPGTGRIRIDLLDPLRGA